VIGALPTIGVIIFTAILGAFLLRQQGLSTLRRVQGSIQQGQVPAIELVEGLILAVCGALLLTPGFFTDTIGFICLVPSIRRSLAKSIISKFTVSYVGIDPFGRSQQPPNHTGPSVIDGEFRRED